MELQFLVKPQRGFIEADNHDRRITKNTPIRGSTLGGRAEGVVIATMMTMTTAEPATVCVKTRASTAVATAMVVTMGPLAAAGMTMASGPAVQGAILTIEYRSVT